MKSPTAPFFLKQSMTLMLLYADDSAITYNKENEMINSLNSSKNQTYEFWNEKSSQ